MDLSLNSLTAIVNMLGLPGLILIIWYFDKIRYEKHRESSKDDLNKVLAQYREDISQIRQLYESNVTLVKNYEEAVRRWEKHADELTKIIYLNTQVQTTLVENVTNNMFCPIVREQMKTGKIRNIHE